MRCVQNLACGALTHFEEFGSSLCRYLSSGTDGNKHSTRLACVHGKSSFKKSCSHSPETLQPDPVRLCSPRLAAVQCQGQDQKLHSSEMELMVSVSSEALHILLQLLRLNKAQVDPYEPLSRGASAAWRTAGGDSDITHGAAARA